MLVRISCLLCVIIFLLFYYVEPLVYTAIINSLHISLEELLLGLTFCAVNHKKRDILFFIITLANLNRFI